MGCSIFVVSAKSISRCINLLQLLKGFLVKAFIVLRNPIWVPDKHQILISLVNVSQ